MFSFIASHFKRRFSRHLNSTDDTDTFDLNYSHSIKEVSTFTRTQMKVMITVVLIISLIMFIIAIFRFKNACRTVEVDHFQSDIIRNRASQYSEPSSRRGSVGYYTQRYQRTTNIRFDEQLTLALPGKRLSIPACDHSSKSTAVVVLSSSPGDPTDATHHHHVTSFCDTSNLPNQQIAIDCKSSSTNQYDDQTPLLISELPSTTKNSSILSTRKYSLNALLPFVRPSISHPLCSSLTSTIARGIDTGIDLKSRRRLSLSSTLQSSSFAKRPQTFCTTIDSTTTKHTTSPPVASIDSDSSDRTSILSRNRKKSSSITPLSSYPKDFMHKIERFRFIDDSASSTTTVTSPIESLEPVPTNQTCRHLITSAIEQFDDYVRTTYQDEDDANSLIDGLNSDSLTNGSYSDLNILNYHSSSRIIQPPQTFKTVNERSVQATVKNLPTGQQHSYRPTMPIHIPHSMTSLPLSRQGDINGHSQSMDFQSIAIRRELFAAINETSSSSATLTSIRSSTSLEFDDNTKPSGVLVDDDFLPMSSPIDEHFWTTTSKNRYKSNRNESFPNVGSSPELEVKYFDLQQLNTLSETSCDEDDEEEEDNQASESFSIHQYKIKEFQQPILITKSISPIAEKLTPYQTTSDPSIDSTEQFTTDDFLSSTTTEQVEEDETPESSPNDASEGEESADNGEIDLVQEFQLSQKEGQMRNLWSINDHDIYILDDEENLTTTPTMINRSQPTSIMKMTNNKTIDHVEEQQQQQQQQQVQNFRPKVRFNLDPQYEREREWNKVNKLLGNSVEWTDEFEV